MSAIDQPKEMFRVEADVAGPYFAPAVFRDNVAVLIGSLEFARIWNDREDWKMTRQELEEAAAHAEAIANKARTFAARARSLEVRYAPAAA